MKKSIGLLIVAVLPVVASGPSTMLRVVLSLSKDGFSRTVFAQQSGNDLFQQALSKERAEGQSDEAIRIYERIVKDFATDRPLTAKALLQIGRAYERLGKADAQKAYERLVREYADQRAVADEARVRLAALVRPASGRIGSPASTFPGARRFWEGQAAGQFLGSPSPDGRYISFVDWTTLNLGLWEVATGAQRLVTNDGATAGGAPYWSRISPDGSQVAFTFFSAGTTGDLRVVRLDNPTVKVLYRNDQIAYPQPFDWSADGKRLLVVLAMPDRTNRIAIVSAVDGSARVLKTLDWRQPLAMSFSPDGRWIVYDLPQQDTGAERDVYLLAADGTRETRLVEHPSDDYLLGWAPDGKTVLFASDRTGTPGAWTIEVGEGKPVGAPRFLRGDLGWRVHPMGFSRTGAFFYFVETNVSDVYTSTLAGAADAVVSVGGRFVGAYESADWSPDGRRLAVAAAETTGPATLTSPPGRRLVVRSVEGSEARELRPALAGFTWPRWSPDGRSILVSGRDQKNRKGVFRVDAASGSVGELLREEPGTTLILRAEWAADGDSVFYVRKDSACSCIVRRDLTSGRDLDIDRMPPSGTIVLLAPSPDGRWLAVSMRDGNRTLLKMIPAGGGQGRVLVEGEHLRWFNFVTWTPDGREVLFGRGTGDQKVEAWRVPVTGGEARPTGLAIEALRDLRLHPDGHRVVFTAGQNRGELWVMENFVRAAKATAARR